MSLFNCADGFITMHATSLHFDSSMLFGKLLLHRSNTCAFSRPCCQVGWNTRATGGSETKEVNWKQVNCAQNSQGDTLNLMFISTSSAQ